ncbi:MAG: hypothetical protein NPIRA01_13770 [Nitrospirales bacterium]|nr:MAG: hypothetical protein NPIRA01_13770 [Nitrospirales bacterium]
MHVGSDHRSAHDRFEFPDGQRPDIWVDENEIAACGLYDGGCSQVDGKSERAERQVPSLLPLRVPS